MVERLIKTYLLTSSGKSAIELFDRIPLVRSWHRFAFDHYFEKITAYSRMFRGVYATFDEARKDIPAQKAAGYDTPGAATAMPSSGPVLPSDYPILFWLSRLLRPDVSIFDLGGYVGTAYYSYRKYLEYPKNLRWTICDVPAVVEMGRDLARTRESTGLSFTDALECANGTDLFLAFGSLQFIDKPLAGILADLPKPPRHLLLNKLPVYGGDPFVTLNDIGPAISPYLIFNHDDFVKSLAALGYELVDEWSNAEFSLHIPYHPEKSIPQYTGFYFRLP